MATKLQREMRPSEGFYANLSGRIPAEEWLDFKEAAAHEKSQNDALREALRLYVQARRARKSA